MATSTATTSTATSTPTNPDPNIAIEREKTKRSVIIIVLVIFAILALISLCCILPLVLGLFAEDKYETGSTATTTEETTYQVGDEFEVGDFTYTVVNAIDVGNTLTDIYNQTQTTSGTFLRVDFTAKNNGSESKYLGVIELTDSEGNTYSISSLQSSILNISDGTFLTVNPGLTQSFSHLYEVPVDSFGYTITINENIFGGDSATVDLGINSL